MCTKLSFTFSTTEEFQITQVCSLQFVFLEFCHNFVLSGTVGMNINAWFLKTRPGENCRVLPFVGVYGEGMFIEVINWDLLQILSPSHVIY